MAIAPFFGRIYSAVGRHISVSRESLSRALAATRVGIVCTESMTENQKTIAEMSVNLAARLYPTLAIVTKNEEDFGNLRTLAEAINPKIEITEEAPAEFSIVIGTNGPPGAIHVSASGWVARLAPSYCETGGPANPYASAAAAALALSEVFRRVFLKRIDEKGCSISLLDYTESTGSELELGSTSIGEVLFVGIGAVGNAALWAMARDRSTSGDLILLDHETVSRSNLQRYALATVAEIDLDKVEVARQALKTSHFSTRPIKMTLEDYAPEGTQVPTTCISLDNADGRRAAQALLPRLVINGWTGEASLGASWHIFDNGRACLACLYHPHGQGSSAVQQAAKAFGLSEQRATELWLQRQPLGDEERRQAAKKLGVKPNALAAWRHKPLADLYTDVVCGAVAIDLPGVQNVEVVPLAHQSVLVGVMMAAELLKRTQPKLAALAQEATLATWDDVLRSSPNNWLRPRPRELGCICGDATYQDVYRSKWR